MVSGWCEVHELFSERYNCGNTKAYHDQPLGGCSRTSTDNQSYCLILEQRENETVTNTQINVAVFKLILLFSNYNYLSRLVVNQRGFSLSGLKNHERGLSYRKQSRRAATEVRLKTPHAKRKRKKQGKLHNAQISKKFSAKNFMNSTFFPLSYSK